MRNTCKQVQMSWKMIDDIYLIKWMLFSLPRLCGSHLLASEREPL
jgi:hypothetical protein